MSPRRPTPTVGRTSVINTVQLHEYIQKAIFTSWKGYVPDVALNSTREIFRDFIKQLLSLGESPSKSLLESAFANCGEQLNSLDSRNQFICTIEREDLCEEFYEIGDTCGASYDEIDQWITRDW